MINGTIVRLRQDRGFGFLRAHSGGVEYFFHHSTCFDTFDTFEIGEAVTFEVLVDPKGRPYATGVRRG